MNILFAVDQGYRKYLWDCIRSIVRFPVKEGYDIYIMYSDWSEENRLEIIRKAGEDARIHFVFVEPELFAEFPCSRRYPPIIYYRIFAARFLPHTLERILYLDTDTIVINSLEGFYHTDFENNLFCACSHVRSFLNKVNQCRLGMEEEASYVNSGVLLMNLSKLRNEQDFKSVQDYTRRRGMLLTLPDQDIITALYGKNIKFMDSMRFNLSDRMILVHNSIPDNRKIGLEWVREHGVIIHYYGKNKPWNEQYHGILNVFYREVLELDKR